MYAGEHQRSAPGDSVGGERFGLARGAGSGTPTDGGDEDGREQQRP